jgi:hypothetical protein
MIDIYTDAAWTYTYPRASDVSTVASNGVFNGASNGASHEASKYEEEGDTEGEGEKGEGDEEGEGEGDETIETTTMARPTALIRTLQTLATVTGSARIGTERRYTNTALLW